MVLQFFWSAFVFFPPQQLPAKLCLKRYFHFRYLLLQLIMKMQMVVEVLGDFIFSCLLLRISTEIQETTEGRKLPVPGSQSLGTVFYVFVK